MLLEGKPAAEKIKRDIINEIQNFKETGADLPKLAIVRVGERSDDIAYEERVLKNCTSLGILAEVVQVDNNIDMVNLVKVVENLNKDPKTHGILVFRPLPKQLDIDVISKIIMPEKDIDCMSPINSEKVFSGDQSGIAPCTPEAVIEILKHYNYDLNGKNIVIVNRSMVLGKPLSMLFLAENSTVTICHSKTKELAWITSKADIVVTGVGKGNYFGPEYFTENSIVIDVGINFENGRLCGDVDFEAVSNKVSAITPVPGGVGTVTSMLLLKHVIKAKYVLNKE